MTHNQVLGIDLGTTNSAVSVWLEGRPVLVTNKFGEVLTPSVVGLDDDGNILTGRPARDRLQTHPHLTQASFKRFMGTDIQLPLGLRQFRAEELSALLLRQLKEDAEAWLGQAISDAIITVPAYFNDVQRRAVKNAASLAGLNAIRLLNEPTAASLAFGLLENREQKYLTFDLGGGTFDVSIIDMFEGVVEVRASSGDVRLGGDDFSDAILHWMLQLHPALKAAPDTVRAELLAKAESMKLTLSQHAQAEVTLCWNDTEWRWLMNEEQFAQCCKPLLNRLQHPVQQALNDARFSVRDLDHILLVGGATRMPLVRQTVARLFGRFPRHDLHPDEAVALGAGVQAGMVMSDVAVEDIILTDVMPFSLGVEVARRSSERLETGFFLPLIERNTFLPVSKMETVNTVEDNQRTVLLKIYQGEARKVRDNIFLGEMIIDVPPAPAGEVSLDVRFTYTLDGLLEVECQCQGNPAISRRIIEKVPGQMSDEQIAESLQKLAALKIHPRDRKENVALLARCSRLYERLLGDERACIDRLTTEFEWALESQEPQRIERSAREVELFLNSYEGVR